MRKSDLEPPNPWHVLIVVLLTVGYFLWVYFNPQPSGDPGDAFMEASKYHG